MICRDGAALTRAQVLQQAVQLAERLPQAAYVINASESRHGFIVGLLAALLKGQVCLLPNDRTSGTLVQLRQDYPGVYCLGDGLDEALWQGLAIETLHLDPFLAAPESRPLNEDTPPLLPAEQVAVIAFTSGTTGKPAPNPKPLGVLAITADFIARRFGFDQAPPPGIVATVPPQHMYGLETTVALSVWGGVCVHSGRPFYPADVADCLAQVPAPRVLVTTPIHLQALLGSEARFPELHSIISATAPLPVDVAGAAEQRFGARVFEIFGFSEAGTVATRRTVETQSWTLCDGLCIFEEGDRAFVAADHFPQPLPFSDRLRVLSPQEFVHLGRDSDSLNIAGKRASLAGLNAILTGLEGVSDGTFYAVPSTDARRPPRLVAFAVANLDAEEKIRAALKEKVDPAFLPRRLFFVDALPRSATGKIPQAALAELWARLSGSAS